MRPATSGVPFPRVETINPKPSRIDLWITTVERDWKALTSRLPMRVKLLADVNIGIAVHLLCDPLVEAPPLGVVHGHGAQQRQLCNAGRFFRNSR